MPLNETKFVRVLKMHRILEKYANELRTKNMQKYFLSCFHHRTIKLFLYCAFVISALSLTSTFVRKLDFF